MRNYIMENKRKLHQYRNQFESLFVGLLLEDYINVITGFDICQFDKDIKTPRNTSLKDHLTKTYGENAAKLVESLI